MARFVRLFARLTVLALFLAPSLCAPARAPAAPARSGNGDPAAVSMHEVRLRKLHLVRPDLIPYPLDFEVVC